MSRENKLSLLRQWLQGKGRVMIAFSGGVDSSFLLKVATQELGNNALAVTAASPFFPQWEQQEAEDLAREFGVSHFILEFTEEDMASFAHNPSDRCYHCKRAIFSRFRDLAEEKSARLIDGTNFDDQGDYRPGMKALAELNVGSPLKEIGFTKGEIRQLSREMELSTWDKPSYACLASRLPYGSTLTKEKLDQIDGGEEVLRQLGFKQFRLRHHGEIARLEISPDQFPLAWEQGSRIIDGLKSQGFLFIALDLEGYRTGSLNEALALEDFK